MEYSFIIAQIIAFICFLAGMWRLQLKEQRAIIFADIPICTLWSLHFYFMGGISGLIINLLSVFRALARCYLPKKHYFAITYLILGIIWTLCLHFYSSYASLFPPIATSIFTYGMLSDSRSKLTNCIMIHNFLWILYGISLASPISCLSPAAGIISAVIGKYRHEVFRFKRPTYPSPPQSVLPSLLPSRQYGQR